MVNVRVGYRNESFEVIEEQDFRPLRTEPLRFLEVERRYASALHVVPQLFREYVVPHGRKYQSGMLLGNVLVGVLFDLVDQLLETGDRDVRNYEVEFRHGILVRVAEYELVAFLERIRNDLSVREVPVSVDEIRTLYHYAFSFFLSVLEERRRSYERRSVFFRAHSVVEYGWEVDSVFHGERFDLVRFDERAVRKHHVEQPELVVVVTRIIDRMAYKPFTEQSVFRMVVEKLLDSGMRVYVFYRSSESLLLSRSSNYTRSASYEQSYSSVFRNSFPYGQVRSVDLLLYGYRSVEQSFRFT